MRVSNIFLVVCVSSVTAFKFPANQTAGLYRAYYDEDGVEVHEKIESVEKRESLTEPPLVPRQGTGLGIGDDHTNCGCGLNLDPANCDRAVSDVKGYLDTHDSCAVPRQTAIYSIQGNPFPVVAFACNPTYTEGMTLCSDGYANTLAQVTKYCGLYIAGTYHLTAYKFELELAPFPVGYLDLGYMRYNTGMDFCQGAESSPSTHC